MIVFNKPYVTGNEFKYIKEAVEQGKISGNGLFTQKVHNWFQEKYGFSKVLLTTSCTDALEMCAIAMNLKEGDEIIVPDYTFVSTANAFVIHGAKVIFADSRVDHPGVDEDKIEDLITPKTRAIVVVHYAGVATDMTKILKIAQKYDLLLIEDAAQSIDSFYISNGQSQPLGSFGDFATFSFHDTKNIISGEGGLLVVNNSKYHQITEIIWEKGTNRSAYFKGEVDKYGWVSKGSSFLPSELISAFLLAQLEQIDFIQDSRKANWELYFSLLSPLARTKPFLLPVLPRYASNNAHMFYLTLDNEVERDKFIKFMRERKIYCVFHYLPLHKSEFIKAKYGDNDLSLGNSVKFSQTLVRLPMYVELKESEIKYIVSNIMDFFKI